MEGKQQSESYAEVWQSEKFRALIAYKRRFIIPMTAFFLIFYFTLPIMTSYSKVLNEPAIGNVSWAWVFAFAQFVMTWTLCILYSRKSANFDRMVDDIKKDVGV
ncbi:hypothetical protein BG53_03305 [Paenibacillus darwinianus]|uniref:DUF485 domain-containing protein n=1 Tax=Paenibacillus darwinianus TaxID=1380763 RepID=A0A9W5S0H9_9BACL|nr:DUF485 domain-containing protein [Paenibacillus darwinianus]EXX85864.1 hypothetical protein BG52_07545 [Paenibacillus darwinianus]EXX87847.1 hypothetical protein BG53_03305 [Paenibacillus darwinianus]EXX88065.1 hypothetical protein CH50_04260 [Paenibacillus darwinianus]